MVPFCFLLWNEPYIGMLCQFIEHYLHTFECHLRVNVITLLATVDDECLQIRLTGGTTPTGPVYTAPVLWQLVVRVCVCVEQCGMNAMVFISIIQ